MTLFYELISHKRSDIMGGGHNETSDIMRGDI